MAASTITTRQQEYLNSEFLNVGDLADDHGIINIQDVAIAIEGSSTLKSVCIMQANLSSTGLGYITAALQKTSTVSSFSLGQVPISDPNAENLGKALSTKDCPLTYLNLVKNQLSEKGLNAILLGLKDNTTLTRLSLHQNRISIENAKQLAMLLERKDCPLEWIDSDSCELNDEALLPIASALRVNTTVSRFYIRGNPIGDCGIQALTDTLTVNSSLQEIVSPLMTQMQVQHGTSTKLFRAATPGLEEKLNEDLKRNRDNEEQRSVGLLTRLLSYS